MRSPLRLNDFKNLLPRRLQDVSDNIVQIYSFSEDQGNSYYVMQLIDGLGLDKTCVMNQASRLDCKYLIESRAKYRPTSPVVDVRDLRQCVGELSESRRLRRPPWPIAGFGKIGRFRWFVIS